MTVKKYRKRPVVIEAIKWTGFNINEVAEFMEDATYFDSVDSTKILIETLEGVMTAKLGDYIIKGVKGEFYPCKPDIFEKTYEEVTNNDR